MQDCLSYQKSNDGERYIYVGDSKIVEVEVIEKFRLLPKTGFYLDSDETFIIPSFRRNLILFLLWRNMIFLVHLEIENLVCFMIQNWLVLALY